MNFSKKNHNFKQKIIRRRKTLKKVNNLILLLIVLSLSMTSCKSDDEDVFTPTLPPITQTGANTFGCYIDGKLLVPRDGEGTFNSPSHGATCFGTGNYPTDYNSSLTIHDYTGNARFMQIYFQDIQRGVNEYNIQQSNCQNMVTGNPNPTMNLYCRIKDETTQESKYYCSIENTGILNITRYDVSTGILSATFSCSAVNKDDANDIIEITEGRFDIVWGTINDKEFP